MTRKTIRAVPAIAPADPELAFVERKAARSFTKVKVDRQGVPCRRYFDSKDRSHEWMDPSPRGWPKEKYALIAYWTGRGFSSREIAEMLNDGTTKDTIRGQWRRLNLPLPEYDGKRPAIVPVALGTGYRSRLATRAKKIGLSPDEFIRRVLISVIEDDLYRAVVDDRFDEPAPVAGPAKTTA